MQAFIFDMDGVIIDSEPIHNEVVQEVLIKDNITVSTEELDEYTGMTSSDVFSNLIRKHHLPYTPKEMTDEHMAIFKTYITSHHIEPIAGIRPLLEKLRENHIPAAVASSSPLHVIQFVTDYFKITDYFEFLLSGEDIAHGKPAPDIYLTASAKLGLSTTECVVLEDSKNGTIAAKTAGAYCIGFINPKSGSQDLSKADITVKNISDIKLSSLFNIK